MNGLFRDNGDRVRFKLPVLVLGSGDSADVNVDGAPLHCLIAPTPMGPALRAFDDTFVNGVLTAAALLKHGDVIVVGEQTFAVAWQAENAETQSHRVVELLNERQSHVETLLTQLTEQREAFRAEKAGVAGKLAVIEAKHREANELREKTRATAAKYLRQQRAAIHAERMQQQFDASEYEQQRKFSEESLARLKDEHERFRRETEATNERIATAWNAMTEAQKQVAAERSHAEEQIATQLQLLKAQKADLAQRESGVGSQEQIATAKLAGLKAEIAGLEQRATHARMILADLEQQRMQKALAEVPASVKASDWNEPVPLVVKHDARSADQLLNQLRQQEQEVAKERQRLAIQLQHSATEREQLNDQRLLVAEQIRQLEGTRRHWQQAETQTVGELETLARSLALREAELDLRANALIQTEVERKHREEQLAESRKAIEAWQAALTQQEARFVQERQKSEQDLSARRQTVTDREAEVGQFFARWDHRYAEACASIHENVAQFADAKALLAENVRECAKARDAALADVQRLTAKSIAFEEVKAAFINEQGPQARRQLRVVRRRWEKRLELQLRGFQEKRSAFESAISTTGDRLLRMQQTIANLADQKASHLAFERGHERSQLKEPVILPFAKAKSEEIITLQRAA